MKKRVKLKQWMAVVLSVVILAVMMPQAAFASTKLSGKFVQGAVRRSSDDGTEPKQSYLIKSDNGTTYKGYCVEHGVAGVSVALYPGVLEQVQRMPGDDLVVIPSSVEKVLILPKSSAMPDRVLGNMVREVNRTMDRKLVLSDRAYVFTKEKPYLYELPGSLVRRWERRKDER